MSVKINFKRRIVVNGREYASVEEMPQNVRMVYDAALAKAGGTSFRIASSGGIRFNGREYARADDMPPEERRLYDLAMQAVNKEAAIKSETAIPVETGKFSLSLGPVKLGVALKADESGMLAPGEQARAPSGSVKWLLLIGLAIALFVIARALGWSGA